MRRLALGGDGRFRSVNTTVHPHSSDAKLTVEEAALVTLAAVGGRAIEQGHVHALRNNHTLTPLTESATTTSFFRRFGENAATIEATIADGSVSADDIVAFSLDVLHCRADDGGGGGSDDGLGGGGRTSLPPDGPRLQALKQQAGGAAAAQYEELGYIHEQLAAGVLCCGSGCLLARAHREGELAAVKRVLEAAPEGTDPLVGTPYSNSPPPLFHRPARSLAPTVFASRRPARRAAQRAIGVSILAVVVMDGGASCWCACLLRKSQRRTPTPTAL